MGKKRIDNTNSRAVETVMGEEQDDEEEVKTDDQEGKLGEVNVGANQTGDDRQEEA